MNKFFVLVYITVSCATVNATEVHQKVKSVAEQSSLLRKQTLIFHSAKSNDKNAVSIFLSCKQLACGKLTLPVRIAYEHLGAPQDFCAGYDIEKSGNVLRLDDFDAAGYFYRLQHKFNERKETTLTKEGNDLSYETFWSTCLHVKLGNAYTKDELEAYLKIMSGK